MSKNTFKLGHSIPKKIAQLPVEQRNNLAARLCGGQVIFDGTHVVKFLDGYDAIKEIIESEGKLLEFYESDRFHPELNDSWDNISWRELKELDEDGWNSIYYAMALINGKYWCYAPVLVEVLHDLDPDGKNCPYGDWSCTYPNRAVLVEG